MDSCILVSACCSWCHHMYFLLVYTLTVRVSLLLKSRAGRVACAAVCAVLGGRAV